MKLKSEKLGFAVLYEDADFIVVDKPAGVVTHPGNDGQHRTGTVANFVVDKVDDGVGDDLRPGIVHRLDKDTSGVVLVAKNRKAYDFLLDKFRNREIDKRYSALVIGIPEHKTGLIDSPIGRRHSDRKRMGVTSDTRAKESRTKYEVAEGFGGAGVSLVDVELLTGRTHQIRVHMAAIGHPVVGDNDYGNRKWNRGFEKDFGLGRQFLHARELSFVGINGNQIKIKSPLPGDLVGVLDKLRG